MGIDDQAHASGGGNRSRRTFLKAGGAAAIAGLAGCTGGGDGGGTDTTTTQTTTTESEGTTTGTTQESVTVTFWPAWGGYYEETFKTMVSRFEENHPNISVNMTAQGSYRESKSALFSAANAGNPPDVGHLDKGNAIVARDSGFFMPMEELWPDIDTGQYLGSAVGTSVIEGTVWSIPFNNSQIVMYYNKDHFEQAGLDPESPPATLQELSSAANTIVDEGASDFGVSFPNHAWWMTSWISEKQEFFAAKKNGRAGEPTEVYLTEDYAVDIFDWWVNSLGDAYHNPGIEAWGPSEQAFQTGKAAMHMNSSGSIAYSLSGFQENDIKVGVAGLPVPGERTGHSMGGAAIWVSKRDRSQAEREAVRTFVKEMTGPELQAYYHKRTGYFPSNVGSFDVLEEENWFQDHPFFDQARQQLEAWEDLPMNRGILMGPRFQIQERMAREVDNMLGGKDVEQALQEAKSFADDQLARYERR